MFIPVLNTLDIEGNTITGDALLTQVKLAHYLVHDRRAHYVFVAKGNQPTLAKEISLAVETSTRNNLAKNGKPSFAH